MCQECQAAPRPGPWRKILYKRWPARQSLEGQRSIFPSPKRSEAASEPLSLRTCYKNGAHAYRMRQTIETCNCPSSTVVPDSVIDIVTEAEDITYRGHRNYQETLAHKLLAVVSNGLELVADPIEIEP